MRTVIERHGTRVDGQGFIHHDDRETTYEAAEAIAGRKLDRRKNYAIIDGKVCENAEWTEECSGCTEYGDYGAVNGPSGCEECGYTGKRRMSHWVPLQ